MTRLTGIIKKEILEITRDIQSLVLLILMPVVFILIMSLSMQALFQDNSDLKISILIFDNDNTTESIKYIDMLKKSEKFLIAVSSAPFSPEDIEQTIAEDNDRFGLIINKSFSGFIRDINKNPGERPLAIYVDPAMQGAVRIGVENELVMQLFDLRINTFFKKQSRLLRYAGVNKDVFVPSVDSMVQTRYLYQKEQKPVKPSAAQQSVPAWLVFSMYFLVLPISLIFHTEKNNGTLSRLKSINIKNRYIISGKIVSYYIISMIQVISMFFVGRFIVPLLGGDTISIGISFFGLFVIASCIALNAISYGLMISAVSKNFQMAASMGIILIIIFAAIGGIMVPKFVMPDFMQTISNISPLSWGLEGFHDIMLRNGTAAVVIPRCLPLLGSSVIMLAVTGIILKRKIF